MNTMRARAFRHPTEWLLSAMESSEYNRKDAKYRINHCSVSYGQSTIRLDSPGPLAAACRLQGMIELLSSSGLFITSDGALAVGKTRVGVVIIGNATLSFDYNIDILSSPEVDHVLQREHVPGMSICRIDMEAFEQAVKKGIEPPLLITSIGWWGSDQSKE